MPCTITGSLEGDAALYAREAADKLRADLLKRTQQLCTACKALEANGIAVPSDDGLDTWWEEHKRSDAAGRRKRAAKKSR